MYIRLIIGKLSILSQPIEPIINCRIFQPITITSTETFLWLFIFGDFVRFSELGIQNHSNVLPYIDDIHQKMINMCIQFM